MKPAGGFGPPTPGLQNRCSAIELRRPRPDLQDEAVYRRYRHFQEAIARKTAAAAPSCVETSSNGFNAETAEDNRENAENNDGQIVFQETICLCGLLLLCEAALRCEARAVISAASALRPFLSAPHPPLRPLRPLDVAWQATYPHGMRRILRTQGKWGVA